MKNKVISTVLCIVLTAVLCVPTMAADTADGMQNLVILQEGITAVPGSPSSNVVSPVNGYYPRADRLTVTYNKANSGSRYLIYLLIGNSSLPNDSNLVYIDQKTSAGNTVSFTVFPNKLESGQKYSLYLSSDAGTGIGDAVKIAFFEYGTPFSCNGGNTCPSASFRDVSAGSWFHEAVDYAVVKGMMNGTSPTTFAPNSNVTRGQIVTILWRLEGTPTAKASAFTDVARNAYYTTAIDWAASNGIVNGMSAASFAPNASITREQFAAILCRFASYKNIRTDTVGSASGISAFADAASVSSYARDAMRYCTGIGIIQGSGNRLMPQGNATRAQAATMLMRFVRIVLD